ncbi:DUF2839 domain-containing protein [Cyanobacterium sp. IPPAS B-1200]|uniref:DUF2839 domain-containing protein n=1 Tax=Cyanobacterium sp. IPPAS B-1200 TaxID=1562720 RepID=UPI0008525482|nr:DUF2839 domain-containing protein [Cyanobacterium sp. IPPAS B-1200]OEJ78813.1 hypothetical protein A5482_02800 [Cyanobacterium sp. IPPAS B-1200]
MGEAKRRQKSLEEGYSKEDRIVSWFPLTKTQASDAYKLTTQGAWVGIISLGITWVIIRFVGPGFGWWHVN